MILAIEGADRVGKETLVRNLKNKFEDNFYTVKTFEFPFNDFFTYRLIYWMLSKNLVKKHPYIFQYIQFLNKFFVQGVILFYSLFYDVIILDRWKASSYVYGIVSGCKEIYVNFLSSLLFSPKYIVVIGDKTYSRNEEEDELEKDTLFQKTVKLLYRHYVIEEKIKRFENLDEFSSVKYFDNSCSKEDLTNNVYEFITKPFSYFYK